LLAIKAQGRLCHGKRTRKTGEIQQEEALNQREKAEKEREVTQEIRFTVTVISRDLEDQDELFFSSALAE
jgi:hypothetical protein